MSTMRVYKETALPGTLAANAIYFIAPAATPGLLEVVVTGTDGIATRHVITKSEVQTMIDNSVAALNEIKIVANIAARDALAPTTTVYVYVQNATGDATVASGGATYLYNTGTSTWIKVSESESLDIALTWASISGKPSSSPAAIDAAVAGSHSHTNKTQIDLIGQNGGGEMTYNGVQVKTEWGSTGW